MANTQTRKGDYTKVPLIDDVSSDNDVVDNISRATIYPKRKSKRGTPTCNRILLLCTIIAIVLLSSVLIALGYVILTNVKSPSTNKTSVANVPDDHGSHLDTRAPTKATTRHEPHTSNTASSKDNLVQPTQQHSPPGNEQTQSSNWQKKFDGLGSESVVRLVDVDGDGKQDIIVGGAYTADLVDLMDRLDTDMKAYCARRNKTYPCIGKLYALRGYDGHVLWETYTKTGVLLMNCVDFDINQDGTKDCIVTGRVSTIEAINVKNGEHLWFGDDKFLVQIWNNYQVIALPDFNNDGVKEVLVVHGGDPNIPARVHNRKSGRLILLDGKTGKSMGARYLEMPYSKESYQSPVLYTCRDGSQYILLGSGGETIPGDFMMISVPDFYRYIMKLDESAPVPNTQGGYRQWPHKRRDLTTGIIVLYSGKKKGVMVPPLMADVDQDGIDDIVMSAYDGQIVLFDGKTMNKVWTADFPNMESYSTPAPGYFNDDDTLDFMVHWSTGAWPFYNESQKVILDGKDGSVIWKIKLRNYEMSSDLTIQTTKPHRDLFLFKVKGRDARYFYDVKGEIHGVGVQRKIQKRHGMSESAAHDNHYKGLTDEEIYEDYKKHNFICENNVNVNSEVFLLDRTILDTPIKVMEVKSTNYTYHPLIHETNTVNTNKTYCIVLLPEDRTTGAIGDTDGDGKLDIVTLTGLTGELVDEGYSYSGMIYSFLVDKVSLEPVLKDKSKRTKIDVETNIHIKKEKDIGQLQLLPLQEQQWLSYFGTDGHGLYKVNKN